MKKIFITLFLLGIIISCTIQKRVHLKGYHIDWKHNKFNDKSKIEEEPQSNNNSDYASNDSIIDFTQNFNNSNILTDTIKIICDEIMLLNGDEIQAKVYEIGTEEIKYKRCDNLDGPIYSKKKNEIFRIKYANGSIEKIESPKTKEEPLSEKKQVPNKKKTNGFSIAGFILGLLGISLLGIIFSGIGLAVIRNNPEKYKGKGLSAFGMIFSIIWVTVLIILILMF